MITKEELKLEDYDKQQREVIKNVQEKGVPIEPYLNPEYQSSCIYEIARGLMHGVNVSVYAKLCYTWRKMREIRMGLEQHLDITQYADPLYSCWQMREIRLGLQDDLDVSQYNSFMYTAKEMRKRRLMLKRKKKSPNIRGDWNVISDPDYDIFVSPDGMNAYFNWHCKRAIGGREELNRILDENGIVYGIKQDALDKIAEEYKNVDSDSVVDKNTLIARGMPAVDGNNGYYEWKFCMGANKNPKVLPDGSIDFDSIQWFNKVEKGQTLAIYHYATPFVNGKTIMGETVIGHEGKEKPPLTGHGFELLSDLKTYVANTNGHVCMKKTELVVNELVVLDHISASEQTIEYGSSVYVKGNIEGPVTIHVTGDLVVDGCVESAQIICDGNLVLKSGINDSAIDGHVFANGNVFGKFFEYVTLHAGENIYFGTSLNANLSSYGEIVSYGNKGGIIGGSSYAEKGFCVQNLGNEAGIHTVLRIGTNEDIRKHMMTLKKEEMETRAKINKLVKEQNTYRKDRIISQYNIGNVLIKTKEAITCENQKLEKIKQKILELEEREIRARRSKIIAEKIMENVQIRSLNSKMQVKPSRQMAIWLDNGSLVMEKQYGCYSKSA